MAERVTKSVKWSEAEWAVVVAAAGPMAPTTWVREAALAAARGSGAVVTVGQGGTLAVTQVVRSVPAAPEERESSGRASVDLGLRVDPAASSRLAVDPAGPDLMAELAASFRRPVGSAGSGGPAVPPVAGSPPAGVGAPSAPAPGGAGSLLVAVVSLLTQRFGARADHRAAASRLIAEGRVTVYGDVVRVPGAPIAEGDDVRIA